MHILQSLTLKLNYMIAPMPQGTCTRETFMLHGHCHGKLDEHNRLSNDLRFDVGIDALELIYETAMEKTGVSLSTSMQS